MSIMIKNRVLEFSEAATRKKTRIGVDFYLKAEAEIEQISGGLVFQQSLTIADCLNFLGFSGESRVEKNLSLMDCPKFSRFGNKMIVGGELQIANCAGLYEIPDTVKFKELELRELPNLTALPQGIDGKSLFCCDLESLRALPDNLKLSYELCLIACPNLRQLPKNLELTGELYIGLGTPIEPDYALGGQRAYDCGRFVYIPGWGVNDETLRLERGGGACFGGVLYTLEQFLAFIRKECVQKEDSDLIIWETIIADWEKWGEALRNPE